MDDRKIIILCGSLGLTNILAQQLLEHGLADMEVVQVNEPFHGQPHEQLSADELRKRLAASMYEVAPQQYKIREGGKGRNKGKRNREWWNK